MAISAGTVAAMLTLDTGKFDGALQQSRLLMESFGKSGVSLSDKLAMAEDSLQSLGKAMTMSVTTTTIAAGTAATKTFVSFDDAVRQVRATMAASEEDTEKLTAAAKKYGAETKFTAMDAAEALNYLALAGYDADKAISALPTVLNLAQAGGLELGYASDLVTDSMSALGLSMSQMNSFSDQLAKTAQKANTNISQLGYGILTVGGTAKSLAGGTVELNTLLGILADNGIKGAEGGTHLRNVLLSLQTPTENGAKLLAQYTSGVFDANGELRSLDEVFQELSASMSSLTDEQRQNVIGQIFNKTDLAAVEALLSGCGDRFAELSGYIADSTGAAQQMADTMEGGIGGSLRSLSSAVEAVGIAFGETLAPHIQSAAEWLTDAARGFAALDEHARSTIVTAAGVAAAAGPVLIVLGKITSLISTIVSGAAAIGVTMGPAGWITAGVLGLTALSAWASRSRSGIEEVKEALAESNAEGLTAFQQGAASYTVDVGVDVNVENNYAEQASTLYSDIYTWLTDGMPDTEVQKAEVNAKIQEYYDSLLSEVNLQESEEQAKLQEQLNNGFITYDTYTERTAEVIDNAETARTELGLLCDESLAFVANYAGKPASVVQEAYGEIDTLEQRTNDLLTSIGLANEALGERGDNAVALTKAGATGDAATYDLAFEHTYQQYELDKAQIETDAQNAAAEAERIWKDAYTAAQEDGDQAGMDLANKRYEQLLADAEKTRTTELAELEKGYVTEFDEMFAGIAQRFPEQAAVLQEAMGKLNLADEAQKALASAWNGENLAVSDLSDELIDALTLEGIDVAALENSWAGNAEGLSNDLQNALKLVVMDANAIDLPALLTENLEGTELGTALSGVLENGYLDGIEGVDIGVLENQLALLSASVGDGLVQGLNDQLPKVRAASTRLANAATAALRSTWVIKSPSRVFRSLGNMGGEGLALGLEDKMARVRDSMVRISDPGALGVNLYSGGNVGATVAGSQQAATGGVQYNISVQGATIRSEDEARDLLRTATKYTNKLNRGVGRQ